MELTLDRSVLQEALAKTQGIIEKRTTSQVLSNVLIESSGDGQVTFTCTDYDVMWSGSLPAEVVEPGTVATCGKQMFEVVRTFAAGRVVLVTEDTTLKLRCGASEASFTTVETEDFPRLVLDRELDSFTMPKQLLREMIERCQFSISNDEARPALNGALFRVTKAADAGGLHLLMVTTDGHRLSKVERDLPGIGYGQTPAEAILHRKGIQELKKVLEGPEEEVEVAFDGGRDVLFSNDGGTLKVRQVDARYPNYEKVIPTSSDHRVGLPRDTVLQALRLCSSISAPKSSLTQFHFESGRLTITGSNPDLGAARQEIAVDFDGASTVIGFNYRYLMDILNAVPEDEPLMEFSDAGSQTLFRTGSDPGALYVVMPMRV